MKKAVGPAREMLRHTLATLAYRGGKAIRWEDLESRLAQADIVVSAVSSSDPVISRQAAKAAVHQKRGQPLFFLDLGIPAAALA